MSAIQTPPPRTNSRGDLRLRMVDNPDQESLDGAWWPWSRDLILEMRSLAAAFPSGQGRISRVGFSRPDWDGNPRQVDLGTRLLKMGSVPDDDTHVLTVHTSDDRRLTLLVVPHTYTADQGEEAMLAASTAGNSHSAAAVLAEVTNKHDVDPLDQWANAEDGIRGPRHGPPARAGT